MAQDACLLVASAARALDTVTLLSTALTSLLAARYVFTTLGYLGKKGGMLIR